MTNEELVKQIQAGVDVQNNLGLLYEQNEDSIEYLAEKYSYKIYSAEKEDLMQEAYFALVQAVAAFDFSKTQVFYPYFELRMKTAFARWCSSSAHIKKIPEYLTRKIIKYSYFLKEYVKTHGCEPSDEVVMNAFNMSQKQLKSFKQTMKEADCLSLDEVYTDDGNEWISNISDGSDMEDEILHSLMKDYCNKILWQCVDRLEAREAVILHEIYEENKTHKEIAELESCTDDAIRIVEKKALNKLRKMQEVKYIACEMHLNTNSEYSYESIGNTSLGYFNSTGCSSVESAVMKKLSLEKSKVNLQRLLKKVKGGNVPKALSDGISQLKEKYSRLLTLRYIEGYSMKEVAKIMNMNKTYVSGLHAKALNQLNEITFNKAV